MRYIEVQEGLSIAIEDIEAIQKIDDFQTDVYTHHHHYTSTFPYLTLLDLLEREGEKEEKESTGLKPETEGLLKGFLEQAGTFAG